MFLVLGTVRMDTVRDTHVTFVERVLRTLGEPWHEDEFASFQQAEGTMAEIVGWPSHQRLQSGIGYVTPAAMHFGEANRIHDARGLSSPRPDIGERKKT